MFNPTLKRKETILFFLIVVINGLIWIDSDIGLDTCARGEMKGGGIKNEEPIQNNYHIHWWVNGPN